MKQTLKAEIFGKRKALSKEEVKEKSAKIKKNLCSLPEFKKSKNILFYASFNNEIDTIELIKKTLKNREKKVIVPFIQKNNPILQLSEIKNLNELEPKTFSILEPKSDYIKKFDLKNLDLVLVPGIVFDKTGHRIGYGYYDRFLKRLKERTIKIWLVFDFQLVDKIPEEKHDVAMDIVITDKDIIRRK